MTRDAILEEAYITIKDIDRCTLDMSVGIGKTSVALKKIQNIKGKILVVIPKISVIDTWLKEITRLELNYLLSQITFVTYKSLNKADIFYDIVIFDEIHSLTNSHIEFLNKYKNPILGLTGTMPNKFSEKFKIIQDFAPVAYKYTLNTAIDNNLLNKIVIVIHSVKLDTSKNIKVKFKNGKSFYTSELDTYNFWSNAVIKESSAKAKIMRMKALMSFNSKLRYAKKLAEAATRKTIVFCNTKEQADYISPYNYYSGNPNNDKNLEKFNNDEIKILSCVLQLNEGINLKNLDNAIILHSYSSDRNVIQRIGRLVRLIDINQLATIHILMYADSIDEQWVANSLSSIDNSKIVYL